MLIRVRRNLKDMVTEKPHRGLTRRDFLKKGLATGTATALLPYGLFGSFKNAMAATSCPAAVRQPGALAQIFRDGGASSGASFIHSIQASGMTAAAAAFYGIVASDLVQTGTNWYVSKSSPFGIALLTPPPGYTQTTWNAVLAKTSLGGHFGPFAADDGAGENLGNLGSASGFKNSSLGTDLGINAGAIQVGWAQGYPSANIQVSTDTNTSSLTPASIASSFGMNPASGTTPTIMTNSATAADSLSSIFANIFNIGARKFGTQAVAKAVCGFYGDSVLATPGIGTTLFDPTQIAALASATIKPSMLTPNQQALLGAFYQSAIGSIAAVILGQGGCDYHFASSDKNLASELQTQVAPIDYEAGQYVAMFLAACDAAQTPGALISVSNGNCGCNGTTSLQIPNTSLTAQVPVTTLADTGGTFNAGYLLCYNPTTPPTLQTTGTFSMTDGSVTASATVFSVPAAMSGLYLSAFTYLGLNVSAATRR